MRQELKNRVLNLVVKRLKKLGFLKIEVEHRFVSDRIKAYWSPYDYEEFYDILFPKILRKEAINDQFVYNLLLSVEENNKH